MNHKNNQIKELLKLCAESKDVESVGKLSSLLALCRLEEYQLVGCSALHTASRQGKLERVVQLAKTGGDPMAGNYDGWNSLHIACLNGHLDIVKYFLNHANCDPKIGNKDGWNPLHLACLGGSLDLVAYLITEGLSDPSVGNNDGWHSLHIACLKDHLNIVKHLVTKVHVRPMVGNSDGWNSLHIACLMGNLEAVKLLREAGCDPFAGNSEGWTPIHIASWSGKVKVVEYLLSELYVDPNCTTEKGSTPITLTRDTHIRELLLQYGAVLPEVSSISEVASVSTQRRGYNVSILSLQNFATPAGTINIMQRVGTNYQPLLGNVLLKSRDGQRVKTIEMSKNNDVERVVYDIFQKWLTEDEECTWGALVAHLKQAKLATLARDIESALIE